MDDKEKQKFRERYSALPDGTLLDLLKDGETGLVERGLRVGERRSNKKEIDFSRSRCQRHHKTETKRPPKGYSFSWKSILLLAFALSVKQYFDYQHTLDNQKAVNMPSAVKVIALELLLMKCQSLRRQKIF